MKGSKPLSPKEYGTFDEDESSKSATKSTTSNTAADDSEEPSLEAETQQSEQHSSVVSKPGSLLGKAVKSIGKHGASSKAGTKGEDDVISTASNSKKKSNPFKASSELAKKTSKAIGKFGRQTSNELKETLLSRKDGGGTTSEASDKPPEDSEDFIVETTPSLPKAAASIPVEEKDPAERVRKSERFTINVDGPVMKFLLRDSTLAIGALLLISIYPTYKNFESICSNQIPISIMVIWMLIASQIGREWGRRSVRLREAVPLPAPAVTTPEEPVDKVVTPVPEEIQFENKSGYSFIRRFNRRNTKVKFQFKEEPEKKKKRPWTTLKRSGPSFSKGKREKFGFFKNTDPLMTRLLKDSGFRRVRLKEKVEREAAVAASLRASAGTTTSELTTDTATSFGAFDLSRLNASSLEDEVIDPIFSLRGMDLFLADSGEENMSEHPFLIENGLRDMPTWIVNCMTQWGNILVYLGLPEWVKDWDNIEEHEDDPDDVKATKRFFNGTDEYRDARLKMLPSLVDAPRPVKMLAPPKTERTIACALLPTTWKKYDSRVLPDGRILQPCLELELDIMTNRAMRSMASILKRYIDTIALDLALVVERPDGSTTEEPKAVLGLVRFDHIDISSCSELPPRDEYESQEDEDMKQLLLMSTRANIVVEA